MAVDIAAWNIANGLGSRGKLNDIYRGLDQLDADVVVVSEAFKTDDKTTEQYRADVLGAARGMAILLGYDALRHTPYNDATPRVENAPGFGQHLLVLGRSALVSTDVVRLGIRDAISMEIEEPESEIHIRGVGAHFEDRTEIQRLTMTERFLRSVDLSEPVVLAGDLNSMHGNSLRSKVLRSGSAVYVARHLPVKRASSLATRLVGQADGTTMSILTRAGLEDADKEHTPTMTLGGIALFQLDHILTNNLVRADKFRAVRLKGSDHKAIVATLKVVAK